MLNLKLRGRAIVVDRHLVSVSATEVVIGCSKGRRWTLTWEEMRRRAREAPPGWRRAAGEALLAAALDLYRPPPPTPGRGVTEEETLSPEARATAWCCARPTTARSTYGSSPSIRTRWPSWSGMTAGLRFD